MIGVEAYEPNVPVPLIGTVQPGCRPLTVAFEMSEPGTSRVLLQSPFGAAQSPAVAVPPPTAVDAGGAVVDPSPVVAPPDVLVAGGIVAVPPDVVVAAPADVVVVSSLLEPPHAARSPAMATA